MKQRANYEGQTLENRIAVDIQEANQAIKQLKSNITSLKSTISSASKNTGIQNFFRWFASTKDCMDENTI